MNPELRHPAHGSRDGGTPLIGIDWGTTNLRAFRFRNDGAVAEVRTAALGILAVEGGAFEDALRRVAGDWLDGAPDAPVLLSGMIGSRQGWVETPYRPCPAGLDDLAGALQPVALRDGRIARVVPGVATRSAQGVPDVMRGEETQVLGALPEDGARRLVCAPGTHSKWIAVEDGRIASFATFMTGELFDVLRRHSILGRTMEGEAFDPDSFDRGLARADSEPAWLHALFGVRTLALFGEVPSSGLASYLSGLLVGYEVAGALRDGPPGAPVLLIAQPALAAPYERALAARGVETVRVDGAAAASAGLWRIGRALADREARA